MKGVSYEYHKNLLNHCQAVTEKDVLDMIRQYLLPIFDPATSVAVVVCAPGKADEISDVIISSLGQESTLNRVQAFNNAGFTVERRNMDNGDSSTDGEAESSSESGGSSMSAL